MLPKTLVSGFFLCIVVCAEMLPRLRDKCANDTFQSDIPATKYCSGDCWSGNLQQHFPHLYNITGWKRDLPQSLTASAFCEVDSLGVNQSGINVRWGLPNTYGASGIDGYEIRIEDDPADFRCVVIDFEEKVSVSNKHSKFSTTFYPVSRSNHFKVVIYSLPRVDDSEVATVDVFTLKCERGESSSNWTPDRMNKSYSAEEKVLTIWFSAPPVELNITEYTLWLIPLDHMDINNYHKTESKSTQVQFVDVYQGKYKLTIQPHDRHPHDESLCVCKNDMGRCEGCKQKMWLFEIPPPLTENLGEDGSRTARTTALVAAVGGPVLFFLLLFILYKIVAKRYGISVDVEQCKRGKNNHLILVDACADSQNATRIFELFKQDKTVYNSVNVHRIQYNEQIHSNILNLCRKYRLVGQSANKTNQMCCMSSNRRSTKLQACLLVDQTSKANCSEIIDKLDSCLSLNELQATYCVVSFHAGNAYVLNNGVNVYDFDTDAKCILKCVQNGFFCNSKVVTGNLNQRTVSTSDTLGHYVALQPTSRTSTEMAIDCFTDSDKLNKMKKIKTASQSVPQMQRSRFVSNDSGRGGSESSCKHSHSSDVIPDWDDTVWSTGTIADDYYHTSKENTTAKMIGDMNRLRQNTPIEIPFTKSANICMCSSPMRERCPSWMSFFAPSIISESDALALAEADDICSFHKNNPKAGEQYSQLCPNNSDQTAKQFGSSVDSMLDKVALLNKDNYRKQIAYPVEECSVLEVDA